MSLIVRVVSRAVTWGMAEVLWRGLRGARVKEGREGGPDTQTGERKRAHAGERGCVRGGELAEAGIGRVTCLDESPKRRSFAWSVERNRE